MDAANHTRLFFAVEFVWVTGRGDRHQKFLACRVGRAFNMHPPPRPRLNAAARSGQSCSKLSVDEFRSTDTRRQSHDLPQWSTFRQTPKTAFPQLQSAGRTAMKVGGATL